MAIYLNICLICLSSFRRVFLFVERVWVCVHGNSSRTRSSRLLPQFSWKTEVYGITAAPLTFWSSQLHSGRKQHQPSSWRIWRIRLPVGTMWRRSSTKTQHKHFGLFLLQHFVLAVKCIVFYTECVQQPRMVLQTCGQSCRKCWISVSDTAAAVGIILPVVR